MNWTHVHMESRNWILYLLLVAIVMRRQQFYLFFFSLLFKFRNTRHSLALSLWLNDTQYETNKLRIFTTIKKRSIAFVAFLIWMNPIKKEVSNLKNVNKIKIRFSTVPQVHCAFSKHNDDWFRLFLLLIFFLLWACVSLSMYSW